MSRLRSALVTALATVLSVVPVLVRRGVGLLAAAPGRAHRRARANPRRTIVVLSAAVLVFALAAGGFALLSARRAQVDSARADALATAQRSVTTLLSYDYRSLRKDVTDRQNLLTGTFKTDYTGLVTSMILPAADRDQLLTRTNVTAAGVVGAQGTDQVTVLMFINQTSRSVASPDPVLTGSRVRVTLRNQDGRWLVSELKPV